jgi:hypothetical protein
LWLENSCLALAINQGQRVTYSREAPLEIDAVFEGSWGDWAIEIKTGGFDQQDLKGLLEFCRRDTKFRPLSPRLGTSRSLAATACWPLAGSNSWSTVHHNPEGRSASYQSPAERELQIAVGHSLITALPPRVRRFVSPETPRTGGSILRLALGAKTRSDCKQSARNEQKPRPFHRKSLWPWQCVAKNKPATEGRSSGEGPIIPNPAVRIS